MEDFCLGQDYSVFATPSIALLFRGLQKSEKPSLVPKDAVYG
jgi:hypothetical protein